VAHASAREPEVKVAGALCIGKQIVVESLWLGRGRNGQLVPERVVHRRKATSYCSAKIVGIGPRVLRVYEITNPKKIHMRGAGFEDLCNPVSAAVGS
jgi:hypothetical protein